MIKERWFLVCSNKLKFLLLVLVLLFALTPGEASAMYSGDSNFSPETKFIENELIIKLKSDIQAPSSQISMSDLSSSSSDVINTLNSKYGVTKAEKLFNKAGSGTSIMSSSQGLSKIYKVTLSGNVDIQKVAEEVSQDPNVEYAEPNGFFKICVTPNDPYYNRQWGLSKILASEGWDSKSGDPSIVIAVIDTGVDYDHQDLRSNIWSNSGEIKNNGIDDDGNGYIDDHIGWDFVSVPQSWVAVGEDPGPADNNPYDFVGHGTHVSGIAAGRTNNGVGAAGTTWDSKIMPLRAGYAASDGYGYLEFDDAAEALYYAADNGADIINMSWGATYDSSLIRDAIAYAKDKGVVLIASAGNVISEIATKPYYPAYYDGVIAVAATDENDKLSIWSWTVFSNFGDWVDVCAPGTYIYSTLPGNNYGYYSGTSMAAPFVAGLAALVKSKNPSFTAVQIEEKIKASADNVEASNPDFLEGMLGEGRINSFAALGRLRAKIIYPRSESEVGLHIAVDGSADIDDFKEYKLEYGVGRDPAIWNEIANRSNPVVNGNLGAFEVEEGFGDYTIKLTVFDNKGVSYESMSIVNVSPQAEVQLKTPTLFGPSPFNPRRDGSGMVQIDVGTIPSGYVLIDVCIYDLTGALIWKDLVTVFSSEKKHVPWDGRNMYGEIVGNGVYPYLLVAAANGSKKVIGRGKIAVFH